MVKQLSDSVCDEMRAEVQTFLQSRPDLSAAHFAQYTTLSYSAVKSFIGGAIPGGYEVINEVRRVLAMAKAGEIMRPGGAGAVVLVEDPEKRVRVAKQSTFYQTQTVKRVAEVMEYCVENAAIGVITAEFGAGKTESVKAWRRGAGRDVDCVVFEFDEFSSTNKVDFVVSLAKLFGLDYSGGSTNGGRIFREVCEYLRKHPALLIFDQCETLRPRVFQVIRQIWDRTKDSGVGVVLLAAPILMQRMLVSRLSDMGALASRVGVWAPLAGVTRSEMSAIVKGEGFTEVDEDAFELWWKATGGSMRRLMRALDLLRAKHTGKRVTTKTVTGIAGFLWGMSVEA